MQISYFLEKKIEKSIKLSSAESSQRVVKVNGVMYAITKA